MSTPASHPYKVQQRSLRERLVKAKAKGAAGGNNGKATTRAQQRATAKLDAGAYGKGLLAARTRDQKRLLEQKQAAKNKKQRGKVL